MQSTKFKRLMKEQKANEKGSEAFLIVPIDNTLVDWHFTIRGMKGTDYEGGLYHGKMTLPDNYPYSPVDIKFFSRSGRYQIDKPVCLTFTGFHKLEWSPVWNLSTMMLALRSQFHSNVFLYGPSFCVLITLLFGKPKYLFRNVDLCFFIFWK